MSNLCVILGSAFQLPIRDCMVDVVVADPPFETKGRGKKRVKPTKVGYMPFSGREWFDEAWRVLKPSGHLYLFSPIKEMKSWLDYKGHPLDIICWHAPNAESLSAHWRRGLGGRSPVWQPILHYQKPPRTPIVWPDGYVQGNYIRASRVQSNMKEALPWPNQLPKNLLLWLLAPHTGLVLDLFGGTGTTSDAAKALRLRVIYVDASAGAVAVANRRSLNLPLPIT